MNEKLEAIRRACIKANPEIGTLEECAYCGHEFRHRIHIADVLLAFSKAYFPNMDDVLFQIAPGEALSIYWQGVNDIIRRWDLLHDDIEKQEEFAVDFIAERLSAKSPNAKEE